MSTGRCRNRELGNSDRPSVNPAESPIAWLRQRKDKNGQPMLDSAQFEAGERLRADFWFAQMTPRVTTDWSGGVGCGRRAAPGAGVEMSDAVVAARERVMRALAAVGPELSGILVDVCCHLRGFEEAERSAGWPQRSAKVVLQLALTRLARHYGLLGPEGAATRTRLRHWGAAGYRPTLDRWQAKGATDAAGGSSENAQGASGCGPSARPAPSAPRSGCARP